MSAGTDQAKPAASALRGCILMLASMVLFASMHGTVRHLSGEIHPFEVAFFRNVFGLVALAPWFVTQGLAPLRTRRLPLHFARSLFNVVSMLMFFTALSLSPLALVQALGFTAPLFTTLLAVVLLGERIRARRVSALLAGFAGMLVIIRPGFHPVDLGALLTVGSAALWACCMIMIKRLAITDSAITITAWMVILMIPTSFAAALFVWVWPTPSQLAWLLACGLLGTLAQIMMTRALQLADATLVLPLDFTKIVWGALIGWFFFGESVDAWTWAGAVIVFSGSAYITVRERQVERERSAGAR